VWLEKTDGLRQFLVLNDNKMFLIKNDKSLLFLDNIKCDKFTIFDTEFYDKCYYIFDCVFFRGYPLYNKSYIERMESVRRQFQEQPQIKLKKWNKLDSWSSVYDFIYKHKTSPQTHQKIDGVIIQDKIRPYFQQQTYKFKRNSLNTIDFLIKLNGTKFMLYLVANSPQHILRKISGNSSSESSSESSLGNSSENFLSSYKEFQTPFFESMNEFIPRKKWSVPRDLFEEEINEINNLMSAILKDSSKYDTKIIEFGYVDDGWVPFRVREDKNKSNAYATGLSNCASIFSPITLENTNYFSNKPKSFSSEIVDAFHTFSKNIREIIFREMPSTTPSTTSLTQSRTIIEGATASRTVIDLGGGRGGDLVHILKKGFKNLFVVDCDREALCQYVNKASRQNIDGTLWLNVLLFMLCENNSELVTKITARKEWPADGCDLVLMNFAIHYLCDSEQKIIALTQLLTKLLSKNGLFIYTCYDGEEICKDLSIKYKRAPQVGDKLVLNNFQITVTSTSGGVKCSMPLPTIDSSGYREEPLALASFLGIIQKYFEIVTEFYLVTKFDSLTKYENIHDYVKYIKCVVMRKIVHN
jgi:hypothetical protein